VRATSVCLLRCMSVCCKHLPCACCWAWHPSTLHSGATLQMSDLGRLSVQCTSCCSQESLPRVQYRQRPDTERPLHCFGCSQAAVDMMRKVLNSIHMEGVVVIGEGEKDEVSPHPTFWHLVVLRLTCRLVLSYRALSLGARQNRGPHTLICSQRIRSDHAAFVTVLPAGAHAVLWRGHRRRLRWPTGMRFVGPHRSPFPRACTCCGCDCTHLACACCFPIILLQWVANPLAFPSLVSPSPCCCMTRLQPLLCSAPLGPPGRHRCRPPGWHHPDSSGPQRGCLSHRRRPTGLPVRPWTMHVGCLIDTMHQRCRPMRCF
jgi:hypothetical protein